MKKYLFIFLIGLVVMPAFGNAQEVPLDYSGLVQCDGVVSNDPAEKLRNKKCNFQALMSMINYIIKWVFGLTIPIFVGLFAYAGFMYMWPKPEYREKASKMLWAAVKGFAIMLIAWFIVSTLLKWVIDPDFKGADSLLEQNK